MHTAIVLIALASLTGCASIVSKSMYPVTFDSNPSGATLAIQDKSGNILYKGVAPTTLTLDASDGFFSPAKYEVEATLPGHNPSRASIRAGINGWYFGNILFGGLIGLLIVDPATGAMWKLDNRLMVNLGATTSQLQQLHILTLGQVPPEARQYMVRLQ